MPRSWSRGHHFPNLCFFLFFVSYSKLFGGNENLNFTAIPYIFKRYFPQKPGLLPSTESPSVFGIRVWEWLWVLVILDGIFTISKMEDLMVLWHYQKILQKFTFRCHLSPVFLRWSAPSFQYCCWIVVCRRLYNQANPYFQLWDSPTKLAKLFCHIYNMDI